MGRYPENFGNGLYLYSGVYLSEPKNTSSDDEFSLHSVLRKMKEETSSTNFNQTGIVTITYNDGIQSDIQCISNDSILDADTSDDSNSCILFLIPSTPKKVVAKHYGLYPRETLKQGKFHTRLL